MAKKKSATKKTSARKSKGNGILNLIIGLFILLIISLIIAYFYVNYSKKKTETTITQTHIVKNTVEKSKNEITTHEIKEGEDDVNVFSDKTTLEGTWVSVNSGSMLTINGHKYSIDFSSIETPNPIKGIFRFSNSKITFLSDEAESTCGATSGSYSVEFSGSNIEFHAINDPCTKRKSSLESEWFRF